MTACTQLWYYLNVKDATRTMKLFAESDCENGIYNVASGKYKPLKEFVKIIKDVTESQSELKFGKIEYGTNVIVNLTPNVNKIKSILNWEPKVKFEDGIKELI